MNKKEQIFETLMRLYKENGMDYDFTISELARESDIGKGTVYEYFNSKDEIVAETIKYLIETGFTMMMKDHEGLDFELTMKQLIRNIVLMMEDSEDNFQLFMNRRLGHQLSEEWKKDVTDFAESKKGIMMVYVSGIIQKGVKEGVLNSMPEFFNAFASISMLFTMSAQFKLIKVNIGIQTVEEFIDKSYELMLKMMN